MRVEQLKNVSVSMNYSQPHLSRLVVGMVAMTLGALCVPTADASDAQDWLSSEAVEANPLHPYNWRIHDRERPFPQQIDPGPAPDGPVPAPGDAIILFDGNDFDNWSHDNWEILDDGSTRTVPGTGDLYTHQSFGDVQLWVEFMIDPDDEGDGNSGVFLGDYGYEVQILENYHEPQRVAPDRMIGGMYGQYPPLVNASRPPGEWQTFNIIYRAPEFDGDELLKPASFTVFHNNVLVLQDAKLVGPTSHGRRTDYHAHEDVPIMLQEHGDLVRFRNVWVRELD